jgi:hypothetical protein
MIARIVRTANPKRDLKIASGKLFDQSDIVRTTHLGLILANTFIKTKSAIAILLKYLPGIIVGRVPSRSALLKILLEYQFANLRLANLRLVCLGLLAQAYTRKLRTAMRQSKHHGQDRPSKSDVHRSLCHFLSPGQSFESKRSELYYNPWIACIRGNA